MGKKTNEKRKQLFETLKQNGTFTKPAIRIKKPKKQPAPPPEPSCYCRDRYSNDLPMGFRNCADCPIDFTP